MTNFKSYDELDFTDDFIFCKTLTENKELCKELVEIIIGKKVRDISFPRAQKSINITRGSKGVRLDVFVEDSENTVYDLEMQNVSLTELPLRSRYYQGMIDLNTVKKGSGYEYLKGSYIVFICKEDPFDNGLPVYTFTNRCTEDISIELDDKARRLFLNADGEFGNISPKLRSFLHYIKTHIPTDSFTKKLNDSVIEIKKEEKWRLEYMTLEQKYRDIFKEGIEEGIEIMAMLSKGKTRAELLADGFNEKTVDKAIETFDRIKNS